MKQIEKLIQEISSVEFWVQLFESYRFLGPLAPIGLAALESIIPALPLVAIVAFNIASFGTVLGFLYSWIGTVIGSTIVFLFFRWLSSISVIHHFISGNRIQKMLNWVSGQSPFTLFILACLPVTPSSLLNLSFGLSNFSKRTYIFTIALAKSAMILLLSIYGEAVVRSFENPIYILAVLLITIGFFLLRNIFHKKSNMKDLEK